MELLLVSHPRNLCLTQVLNSNSPIFPFKICIILACTFSSKIYFEFIFPCSTPQSLTVPYPIELAPRLLALFVCHLPTVVSSQNSCSLLPRGSVHTVLPPQNTISYPFGPKTSSILTQHKLFWLDTELST